MPSLAWLHASIYCRHHADGRTWIEPRCSETCPVAIAVDLEDLVDEVRHLHFQVVVALRGRARLVDPEVSVHVLPQSTSHTMGPDMRFM